MAWGGGRKQEACASHVRKHDVFLVSDPSLKMLVSIKPVVAVPVRPLQRASRQNGGSELQVLFHCFIYTVRVGIFIDQDALSRMIQVLERCRAFRSSRHVTNGNTHEQ